MPRNPHTRAGNVRHLPMRCTDETRTRCLQQWDDIELTIFRQLAKPMSLGWIGKWICQLLFVRPACMSGEAFV
jgi:hypothetical protein